MRERSGWPPSFVKGKADRDAVLVLASLQGILPRDLHALAWRERSASACLVAIQAGLAGSANDQEVARTVRPADVRDAVARSGARVAVPGGEEYPEAVLHLADPPVCLFVRGRRLIPWPVAVTIVGARRCTPYGREVAEALGEGLASAGIAVVSGAALGIDAAAHRGALRAGGPTAAVLGSGIDVAYPASNEGLLGSIAASGVVLSEYPPGVRARQHHFPARNRICAALGRAVVVVVGALGSGSLITVDHAEPLGREVLAVPGPVTGPMSEVPNDLIREGAKLVRDADDVLEAIGVGERTAETSGNVSVDHLPAKERSVLERLSATPAPLDAVAAVTGLSSSEALTLLSGLELRGLVASEGGRYRRVAPRGSRTRQVVGTSEGL